MLLLAVVIHQPDHIVAADDVDVRILLQCSEPLCCSAQHLGDPKLSKVVPLLVLSRPGVLGHSLRCDHQHPGDLEAVIYQLIDCGQCDDGLAQSHV